MHVIIRKQKCIQCDELKNLLDEKGIQYNYLNRWLITECVLLECVLLQYNYLNMTEMHKTMTYLRMYCNSFPIVLNINNSFSNFENSFSKFEDTLTCCNLNCFEINYIYIIIIIIITIILFIFILGSKKKVEKKVGRLWEAREAPPQSLPSLP